MIAIPPIIKTMAERKHISPEEILEAASKNQHGFLDTFGKQRMSKQNANKYMDNFLVQGNGKPKKKTRYGMENGALDRWDPRPV